MTERHISDPLERTAGKATVEALTASSEDIDRVLSVLPERMVAIVNAMNGWPAGRGFDVVVGRSSVTFCEIHEKERCPCGAGTTYASRSDPVGEAAMVRDGAKADHDRVVKLATSIRRLADELAGIVGRHAPRTATPGERAETLAVNEREHRVCSSCSRLHVSKGVPKWEPAFARLVLHEGGEASWLCQWCWRWVRSEGSLPTVASLEQHHKGVRVRKPA